MTGTHALTRWQRAAALAVEGACLLVCLLATVGEIGLQAAIISTRLQPYVLLVALALLSGAILAPLRLWRTAYYVRLSANETTLPSLRPCGRVGAAILWRWQLWWRRAASLTIACLPCALLLGYGSFSAQHSDSRVTPLLWLFAGALSFVCGVIAATVWQCRYVLAPFFVLRGYPAAAAMALSARAMRRKIGAYVNFLGGESAALLSCLLIVPAIWVLPSFGRRRTDLLLSWMPSHDMPPRHEDLQLLFRRKPL